MSYHELASIYAARAPASPRRGVDLAIRELSKSTGSFVVRETEALQGAEDRDRFVPSD